jgi:hypothetical protein
VKHTIDYSSVFNTIVPSKLRTLGLKTTLCTLILGFLTDRPHVVRVGNNTSTTLTINTGAPQGCLYSSLLYPLFTHYCVATHDSNTIIKFADDTVVVELNTDDDEAASREVVRDLALW